MEIKEIIAFVILGITLTALLVLLFWSVANQLRNEKEKSDIYTKYLKVKTKYYEMLLSVDDEKDE